MSCGLLGFRWCLKSFLLLASFLACQTLAKPQSSGNNSPVLTGSKHCNNVYFYEAPNKKIENLLQEMNKRLIQLQDDLNDLKENKTFPTCKSCLVSISSLCLFLKNLACKHHEEITFLYPFHKKLNKKTFISANFIAYHFGLLKLTENYLYNFVRGREG